MGEHDEFIADFLEECDENLDQLDQELVALEEDPRNQDRLRRIFRNVHTIKGSSGFFGFVKLGTLAHEGEALLGKIRDGELTFNQAIASGLLQMADAIREILSSIEQSGGEGERDYEEVADKLRSLLVEADTSELTSTPAVEPSPPTEPTHPSTLPSLESPTESTGQGVDQPKEAARPTENRPSRETESSTLVREQTKRDHDEAPEPTAAPPSDALSSDALSSDPLSSDPLPSGALPNDAFPGDASLGSGAESAVGRSSSSASTDGGSKAGESTSIRVDVGLLDELMDFAGELVLARNALFQCSEVSESPRLAAVTNRVSQITSEIQDRVTRTRMQPIGAIWGKYRRIVRDLSVACGKQVRLELEGEETELDRSLLEAIRDPLTHIIRNGVDHGIELPEVRQAAGKPREGRLRLWARHESGQVVIEASDDGAGIDVEKVRDKAVARNLMSPAEAAEATPGQILQCIFEPGFSTAREVSAISGRGVGMDVVRSHVEKIGGSVQIRSRLGEGTTLTIKIPLTLAIVPALMVASAGQQFVIPQASLMEVVTLGGSTKLEWVHGAAVCRLRDRLLPLVELDRLLGLVDSDEPVFAGGRRAPSVAVLRVEQTRFGLVVDEVLNTHEIVVKPIGASVKSIGAFSAATILGDGSVALILDVGGMARLAGLISDEAGRSSGPAPIVGDDREGKPGGEDDRAGESSPGRIRSLLVCEVAGGRRVGFPLSQVERLEKVASGDIENVDSGMVVSYRGGVLPLTSFERSLPQTFSAGRDSDSMVHVVVHRRGEQLVGGVVEKVIDVVDVPSHATTASPDPAQAGTPARNQLTLVDGRVLEIWDTGSTSN
jgi:two-component system chemotaxis sensor kinase CheA